jgi:hypothetical protein
LPNSAIATPLLAAIASSARGIRSCTGTHPAKHPAVTAKTHVFMPAI